MCNKCGQSVCYCDQKYGYNWYNIDNYPCNPCSVTSVCKKKVPAQCVFYKGPALGFIGLTTDVNIELVLSTIVTMISAMQAAQDTKNTNILNALNDINSRIVSITGVSYPNYTI